MLIIFIFTIQSIDPASATKNKLIDKGSKVFHDNKSISNVKYHWKTYSKGSNHVSVKCFLYYYKTKKNHKKEFYLKKTSKSKLKIETKLNGKSKKTIFINTRLSAVNYYKKYFKKTLVNLGESGKPLRLSKVKYWAYQLQGVEAPGAINKLVSSKYDLLVLEPTRTVKGEENFNTLSMVNRLKASKASDGIHRKLVMAYIDIGEAEDFRYYWKWSGKWNKGQNKPSNWPDYILTHDPDGWAGDFPVAYWDSQWKDIVIYGHNQSSSGLNYVSLIDEAIKDGFDGVYLDWVEGYENPKVINAAKKDGVDPKVEMIRFIKEIKTYARSKNPNFMIIQQNAVTLSEGHPELYSIIDGIVQESVWYGWNDVKDHDISTDHELTLEYIKYLNQYKKAGIPVFDCEYAMKNAHKAYSMAKGKGFIPYCSEKLLSHLSRTPPASMGWFN